VRIGPETALLASRFLLGGSQRTVVRIVGVMPCQPISYQLIAQILAAVHNSRNETTVYIVRNRLHKNGLVEYRNPSETTRHPAKWLPRLWAVDAFDTYVKFDARTVTHSNRVAILRCNHARRELSGRCNNSDVSCAAHQQGQRNEGDVSGGRSHLWDMAKYQRRTGAQMRSTKLRSRRTAANARSKSDTRATETRTSSRSTLNPSARHARHTALTRNSVNDSSSEVI